MSKPFDYANATIADFIEREQYDQRLVGESDFLRAAQAAFDDAGEGDGNLLSERTHAIRQSPEYRAEVLRLMREKPIYKPRPEVLLW